MPSPLPSCPLSPSPPTADETHQPRHPAPGNTVDGTGLLCVTLLLRLRKEIDGAEPGTVVHVIATDPATPLDLPAWCHLTRHHYLQPGDYIKLRGGHGTDSDAKNVVYRDNCNFPWNKDKDTIYLYKHLRCPRGRALLHQARPRPGRQRLQQLSRLTPETIRRTAVTCPTAPAHAVPDDQPAVRGARLGEFPCRVGTA